MSQPNEPMVRVRRVVEITYEVPVNNYLDMTLEEIRTYELDEVPVWDAIDCGEISEMSVEIAIDGEVASSE